MKEKWSNIEGFENYQISTFGRLKSLGREVNHGRYKKFHPEIIVTNKRHNYGYLKVTISRDGKKHQFLIHRLVASAFLLKEDGKDFNFPTGAGCKNCVRRIGQTKGWIQTTKKKGGGSLYSQDA